MLKVLLLVSMFLSSCSFCLADIRRTSETLTSTDSVVSMAVPSTATVYTKSFSLQNHEAGTPVAIAYKATASSGSISVTIDAEQSYQRPTTEAASDVTYVGWERVATTLTNNAWHIETLDTVVAPYGRIKIIGNSGNSQATTVDLKLLRH